MNKLFMVVLSVAIFVTVVPAAASLKNERVQEVARKRKPPVTTSTSTSTVASTTTSTSTTTIATPIGITPEAFGATGNGTTDDCAALQLMFDSANGRTMNFTPGKTYKHSCVLTIKSGTVNGNGTKTGNYVTNTAVIASTNPETSAIHITGQNVTVKNIKLTSNAQTRWLGNDQHKLCLFSDGTTVDSVEIDGSAGAGFYMQGASNYKILNSIARNTQADSFHNTGGSYNGYILNPYIENSGDDGVAVVSYGGQNISHDITVDNPIVRTGKARGVAVVGGQNIYFNNINIDNTRAAGIYVSREPSYTTLGVNHVRVTGGTVTRANYDTNIHHGSILIYAEGGTVNDVIISGIQILNPSGAAPWNLAAFHSGYVTNSVFKDITVKQPARPQLVYDASGGGLTVTNVQFV